MIDASGGKENPRKQTCLIVPCYNEARRLDVAQFREFLSEQRSTSFIFADDGSRDNTIEVLKQLCQGFDDSTYILRANRNLGKAETVRRGILYALDHLAPAFVGFWDADLATPLAALPSFMEVLHEQPEIDMVFGARVQLLGRHVQRSATRHYLGRIFATVVSVVLQLPIYDSQCGAKLFRVSPQIREVFADPFLSKWVFDVEILARYHQLYQHDSKSLSAAIYEYPLESWVDVAGSKVRPTDFFIALWDILRIQKKYLTRRT